MAFKRKDVKKASYYVWFLGAKESKGLRGDEYVVPVLQFLIDKERQLEPSKVTLQVNNKGIKIVQTLIVPKKSSAIVAANPQPHKSVTSLFGGTGSQPKTEQIKHMIPHHSITWVSQEEDIICCILLIYNPVTKCPVHVHAYRCDSIETATSLRNQLQVLIDRPENQKKFREIEIRLVAKGLMLDSSPLPPAIAGLDYMSPSRKTLNSDGRSTRTDNSDNSDESLGSSYLGGYHNSVTTTMTTPRNHSTTHNRKDVQNSVTKLSRSHSTVNNNHNISDNNRNNAHSNHMNNHSESTAGDRNDRVSTLYESLAAEFRAKLGNPKTGPILLPPRDYDTISRKRGKLEGIEYRKSTNTSIVGPTGVSTPTKPIHPNTSTTPHQTKSSLIRSESSAVIRPLARRSYYFDRIDSFK